LGESAAWQTAKKDIRNAVEAAAPKAESWGKATAHNRAQVALTTFAERIFHSAAKKENRRAGRVRPWVGKKGKAG